MSNYSHDAGKSAKMTTLETVIAKLKSEASKEVFSAQDINQAIGQAVLSWLPNQDEKILISFFAGIEIAGARPSPERSSAIRCAPPPSRRSSRLAV